MKNETSFTIWNKYERMKQMDMFKQEMKALEIVRESMARNGIYGDVIDRVFDRAREAIEADMKKVEE